MSITSQLPKLWAGPGEIWYHSETTSGLRAQTSGLGNFDLETQECTFLGCLEDGAARAHTLCGENTEIFNNSWDLNAYVNEVKDTRRDNEETIILEGKAPESQSSSSVDHPVELGIVPQSTR